MSQKLAPFFIPKKHLDLYFFGTLIISIPLPYKHINNTQLMKVGITFVAFRHLHAGYIQMLEEARKHCDYLIVGLNTTSKEDLTTLVNHNLTNRYIQLYACKYVDEIIPYENETDVENILRNFKIDIRIIGEEYRYLDFTGKEYCLKNNITIFYNSRNLKPYLTYKKNNKQARS